MLGCGFRDVLAIRGYTLYIMDHASRNHNGNDNGINNFARLQQQQQQHDTAESNQVEPTVFLVPLSGDDTDSDYQQHHPHRGNRRQPQQQQQQQHGYDSTSTNDEAFISDYPTNYNNHLYETASNSDSISNSITTTTLQQQNILSSYSAPTDEEEAYYNRYYNNTSSRNHGVSQSHISTDAVGTSPTNPIKLHLVDSAGAVGDDTNDDNFTNTRAITEEILVNEKPDVAVTDDINVNPPVDIVPPNPNAASKMSFSTPSTDDWNDGGGGGRLWRLAGEVAAGRISLLSLNDDTTNSGGNHHGGGPVRQIKESFLERMRSRADPDAITTIYSTSSPTANTVATNKVTTNGTIGGSVCMNSLNGRMFKMPMVLSSSSLSNIQEQTSSTDTDEALYREDEAFLINTGLAQKRVRVVQLMIIGLFGILLPWMGNVFVSSNCHFASIHVVVGAYGNVYPLHFGLWNYSPVSSALNGYKYCYPYYHSSNSNDDEYSMNQYPSDPPITSRICNSLALLSGTYSLFILWWYLISGHVRRRLWKGAVHTAFCAGLLQLATPISFFLGRTCRNNHCSVGPGTVLSALTAVCWMVFGAELHYHCPIINNQNDNSQYTENAKFDSKTPRHGNTSTWFTRTGNYLLWNDVRSSRQHSSTNATLHQPPVVDVSQLEMSDFTSASQQYFNRFYPYRSDAQYNPPEIS